MFHELLVAWRDFPVGEASWQPHPVIAVDVSKIVTRFMEFHDDPDMVSKMRCL
jgi:hypothetical protein